MTEEGPASEEKVVDYQNLEDRQKEADEVSQYEDYYAEVDEEQKQSTRKEPSPPPTKKNPNFKPIRGRKYSPPMIKEYDPNEDNAKTRAKRRVEELKKKDDNYMADRSQYPDHPTPWKGKPSDFFIVHETRRGT